MKILVWFLASMFALMLVLVAVPLFADIAPEPSEVPSQMFLHMSTPPPPRILEAADAFCLAFECDGTVPVGIAPAVPAAAAKEPMGPPAPRGRRVPTPDAFMGEHKPERHFGFTNILVTGALGVSAGFDIQTTLQARSLAGTYEYVYPDGHIKIVSVSFHEKTGFYRAAAMKGSAGRMGLQKAKLLVPIAIASHYMRRSKSKALRVAGWLLPAFATGIQLKAGLDNTREINRIDDLLVP